jgi:hypothetical protein
LKIQFVGLGHTVLRFFGEPVDERIEEGSQTTVERKKENCKKASCYLLLSRKREGNS